MTADLTIEMLQKCILTNRYPFTHHKITQELIAIMQREAKLREACKAVDGAYCGVGDFEGTGQNMASVIMQVRKALSCEYKETEK